jgi:queuine tRNA-ribosyltransferase
MSKFVPQSEPLSSAPALLTCGDYKLVERNGAHFIVQTSSAEVMHPSTSPDLEAYTLYVAMSGLRERLREELSSSALSSPLVVWDVGLGATFNAMAVIRERESLPPEKSYRPLHLISFENDLDSLRLVLERTAYFPHLNHPAPQQILSHRRWENRAMGIVWEVIEGNFAEKLLGAPHADVILYDLFSPNSDRSNWGYALFQRMYQHANQGAVFVSYSRATAVKTALLAAGFYVDTLPGIPPKEEHVIAWKGMPQKPGYGTLLSVRFLERWKVSHKKFPYDVATPEEILIFSEKVDTHPQWGAPTLLS